MASRLIFPMKNPYFQGGAGGICTVASLQWCKRCLELKRGLGSFDELLLTPHQLNALMAVWRKYDNKPVEQTKGMGLKIVGTDKVVSKFAEVQSHAKATAPHLCIFWTAGHTMGYRAAPAKKEYDFFDVEQGLYLASTEADILQTVTKTYTKLLGMRVVQLP